ncbi:hypothetical protein [Escherichia coli]|uniref:hypothetical protein n=1 Tax=Escherichia coli TaxID=562 RepID=UPI001FCE3EFB|nr:hypothetical protein [Escherichia coli]
MMGKEIKDGERFQVGEVWISPRGYLYLVKDIMGAQAILRMGASGGGRKVRRHVDAINGWTLYKPEE